MHENKFQQKIKFYTEKLKKDEGLFGLLGNIKLLLFASSLFFGYQSIRNNLNIYFVTLTFVSLIFLIGFFYYQLKISEKIKFSKDMIIVNNKYLDRTNGKWSLFKDIGYEFIDSDHNYCNDLDIIGENSLFQLINITNTIKGRKKLTDDLLNSDYSIEEIISRQKSIIELGEKLDFCQRLEIATSKIKELLNPVDVINEPSKDLKSKAIKAIITLLPIITTPIFLGIFIFRLKQYYMISALLIIIHATIWCCGFLFIPKILFPLGKIKKFLENYSGILNLINNEAFSSEKLIEIKTSLFKDKSSLVAIKELAKISEKVDISYNLLFYIIFNILFLWDWQCLFLFENWKLKYGGVFETWLESVGEIESLASLSVILNTNENLSFPKFNEAGLEITAKALGHPLINSENRICNDVSLKDNIFVITGSNMSGKTTFLRTVGFNCVLAYCGAPVCAEQFLCAKFNIHSSVRIADDLNKGISTFYAELIRIKKIIEESKKNSKMLFLIDEIFKGTNSVDRILGAETVIKSLNKAGVIGIITTHDMELTNLANPANPYKYPQIKNYHFSEYYKNNEIFFDYKLKDGKSTTTNAKFLMKMVGIDMTI